MATPADFARIGNYARMYNKDQRIDRSKCTRTVPMKVLALGYSRTGTLTMQKALEILGHPTYHFSSVYDNVGECDLWLKALDAKYNGKGEVPTDEKFWDGLLGHVGAVTDAPCNMFAKELIEVYPDAKIVLVERNLESWFKSWTDFCHSAYNPVFPIIQRLEPHWAGRIMRLGGFITGGQAGWATNVDQVRVRSRDAYRHHYRDVRELVKDKKRLLDFDLKQGWKPLCEFLGQPIPDVPFPHENDRESNKKSFEELGVIAVKNILKNALLITTLIGVPVGAVYYQLYLK